MEGSSMIDVGQRKILLQPGDIFPNLKNSTRVYVDFETTSEDDDLVSINPWHNCKLLGVCITVDDCRDSYYIPLRHRSEYKTHLSNIDSKFVLKWLRDIFSTSEYWVNHNIKYDAHALANDPDGFDYRETGIKLVDTLTNAKLLNSDRFIYSLSKLSSEWLYDDISEYEDYIKKFLKKTHSKDYAVIPIDKMAEYGCQDVITVRKLDKYIRERMPESCSFIVELERDVTEILYNIERTGLRLNAGTVCRDYARLPLRIWKVKKLLQEKVGRTGFRPNSNPDCYEVLCGDYGLPVLERTAKEKKPSFGSPALKGYLNYPGAPVNIIKGIRSYRKRHKLFTAFTSPYMDLHMGGYLHSDYNQIVTTGRMSCRNPNAQQLSTLAKRYIAAENDDYELVDIDLSQIEFRTIVHYIQNQHCIQAYEANPHTDFHNWVAKEANILRDAAKTMNFRIGYGGGRAGVVGALSIDPNFVALGGDPEYRGNQVYDAYHNLLPELKPTSWRVSKALRSRGYVFTVGGRHRHLPNKLHFKAFNSVCQGSAADIMKIITRKVSNILKGQTDVKLVGIVHDSWVLQMPKELKHIYIPQIRDAIEETRYDVNFRVPITCSVSCSGSDWSRVTKEDWSKDACTK
jgi:DNA polymerase-1